MYPDIFESATFSVRSPEWNFFKYASNTASCGGQSISDTLEYADVAISQPVFSE